jgi:hypothetical protein
MPKLSPDQEESLNKKGWYDDEGIRIVPLSKPIENGPNEIKELKLSEPTGFYYEKYGQPFSMFTGGKKLADDQEDSEAKIEINVKKLNRYVESSNTPEMSTGSAKDLSMSDVRKAHEAMLDFFGR